MKIVLVRSRFSSEQSIIYPPLSLVTIAPYFRGDVIIKDLQQNDLGCLSPDSDITAFTAFTTQLPLVQQLIEQGKNMGYKSKYVVGGPGVTSNLEYAKRLVPSSDLLVAGDGEWFAINPEDHLLHESVDFRNNPFSLEHKKQPSWWLTNYQRYFKTTGLGVETSRGCPLDCFPCTSHMIHGRKWRGRKPEDVVHELKTLKYQYDCSKFYFADDNATANPERWFNLMQQIADAKLYLKLSVPEGIQAQHLDYETLFAMKEAGLNSFTVGAESGVQRVLDDVICKGGLTVEKTEEVIRVAVRLGMKPSYFFMVGFSNETYAEAKATVDFAAKLRMLGADSCTVRNVIPMPGTRLFEQAKTEGSLTVPEEQLFDFKFVHEGKHLLKGVDWKPEQIEALVAKAKLQESKHYLAKHPAICIKHPRSSLRLMVKS